LQNYDTELKYQAILGELKDQPSIELSNTQA